MDGFHRSVSGDQNHVIHFREYADKNAREHAQGLDASHLHKVALQRDEDTLWLLTSINPVEWKGLGGDGGGRLSGEIISWYGTINGAGRPVINGQASTEWGYCDGRTYTAPDGRQVTTPNLRDRFIMCTGNNGSGKGQAGGAAYVTQSEAQMRAHKHIDGFVHHGSIAFWNGWCPKTAQTPRKTTASTNPNGSSGYTSAQGGSSAMENRPPFMKVPCIMYL